MFNSNTVKMVIECETCGSEMYNFVSLLETDSDNIPVLRPDLVLSQEMFYCDMCGATTYLGDLEDIFFHEGGEDEYESEEDEDNEDNWP